MGRQLGCDGDVARHDGGGGVSTEAVNICRTPAKSSGLKSPAQCVTPPEQYLLPPAKILDGGKEYQTDREDDAGSGGVRDSAVELTKGVVSSSGLKAANIASSSLVGKSNESFSPRPSPHRFYMDELKRALRERLRGEEATEDVLEQLSNLGDTSHKELESGDDCVPLSLEEQLEREQQQVADLQSELRAVSHVNRTCTVEVSVLSQKVAALQEAYAQAESTARAAVEVLRASHEDYTTMTFLMAELDAERALEQEEAVELSAAEHQMVILELEQQLKEQKQLMRFKQEQVSATDTMSRTQKEVIYRLREEVSMLQQAQKVSSSAAEGELLHGEAHWVLERALQTTHKLGKQVTGPLADVVAELEGQLMELQQRQKSTVRPKLRRSLECRRSLDASNSMPGWTGRSVDAVHDDELLGIIPTTLMSHIAALLLAIRSDTEAAKGKRPKSAGLSVFTSSSLKSAQAAQEAAQRLCDLLSSPGMSAQGTAELVLRGDGVGIATRRLSTGSTTLTSGLRLALLELLNRMVACSSEQSAALSDLVSAGGIVILTAMLSGPKGEQGARLAAARLLCALSSLPWCWPDLASQGAARVLVSALDTDSAEDAEVVELAAVSCSRLSADEINLDIMRRAGGRWLLGATVRAKASTPVAREAALLVLREMDGEQDGADGDNGEAAPLPDLQHSTAV